MEINMKRTANKVSDLTIAYIGGGSRGWARGLMSDLAKEVAISGTIRLYDIDRQAADDNVKIGNSLRGRNDMPGDWVYKSVDSLKEALQGADFVIISILPGTFLEMKSDVHAPEQYGIYQSVGDSAGPGGIVRALRTIPMYVKIAEAIKEYSPQAWVINYTNPMTMCVRTLYRVFPGIKAFGCCHEVFGTQKLLKKMVEERLEGETVLRDDIKVNVAGVNHFTWLDSARYKGLDLIELYRKFVAKYKDTGYEGAEKGQWMNNTFVSCEKVKFDLFKRYGMIAAAGDRHLAEFVPGSWYLKDPETVKSWGFSLTSVDWRIDDLNKRLEKSQHLLSGEEQFELQETGEDGVKQIKALVGFQNLVTNVNLPNYGQMIGVPLGAVVETNALFTDGHVTPVHSGRLPDSVLGLVHRQIMNQETVVDGAMRDDYEMVFRAFVNDPLVNISLPDAKKLFNQMLDNSRKYLKV
jgi:alpha-galactosidase